MHHFPIPPLPPNNVLELSKLPLRFIVSFSTIFIVCVCVHYIYTYILYILLIYIILNIISLVCIMLMLILCMFSWSIIWCWKSPSTLQASSIACRSLGRVEALWNLPCSFWHAHWCHCYSVCFWAVTSVKLSIISRRRNLKTNSMFLWVLTIFHLSSAMFSELEAW